MGVQLVQSISLLGVIVSPLAGFVILALRALIFANRSEKFVSQVARGCFVVSALFLGVLLVLLAWNGNPAYSASYLPWFTFEHQKFQVAFAVDSLSLGFLTLTVLLAGLISNFSETYLHREKGHERFHMLLLLATFGMGLVVTADNLGIIVIGWEFLGISSTLLVAFFHTRSGPVVNGLRVFTVYRVADLGLLLALLYAHHTFGESEFSALFRSGDNPFGIFRGTSTQALIFGLFLLFSAAGKSSILPFSPWLPKAMEGPTPSSAMFYGAFAVHAGPYLFLRSAPLVSASHTLSVILAVLGLSSALFSSILGRTRADVKTSLAYATMVQVSLIYAEIGFHFYYLAAFHMAGHMWMRTYQFLRAPSALHDIHIRESLGVAARRRSSFYDVVIPRSLQRWLYQFSFFEGGLTILYERVFLRPFVYVGQQLSDLEARSEKYIEDVLCSRT